MTEGVPLRLVDETEAGDRPNEEPKVFVRQFSTPSAAPWDQNRAASMEARLGAPLPLTELVYQLQRLDGWRPGQPARFAAFYARTAAVGDLLEATVDVDGRPRLVRFVSSRRQANAARRGLLVAISVGVMAVVTVGSITMALSTRANLSDRVGALQPQLVSRLKMGRVLERHRREAQALESAGVKGRALSDYMDDLAWASAAKSPDARISVVHWDHGLLAVEARGDAAPFVAGSRQVTRVDKPIRPGLWLWGVSPASREAAGGEP